MVREFTCIVCPNGCDIQAEIKEGSVLVTGASCKKGEAYVKQELTDPRRNLAVSVCVKGGKLPLASVRLTNPIPKSRIFDAVKEIKTHTLTAPVHEGTVVIHGILGYDSDVIVTREVEAQ